MIGIKYKDIKDIPGVIAPQNILIDGNDIFVFDKINIDEGRLYRFDSSLINRKMVIEVDDGECFFGRDGYVYILSAEDDSIVEVYDKEGNKIKDIIITGTTYFIDIDSNGYIYAIFLQDDSMSIRMYDNDGSFVRIMHSRNMKLLSNLYCNNEYIYAAGFSEDVPLRIEKLNYMSYITDTYELEVKDEKTIVSKILKYNNYLIAALSGDNKDSIILIDQINGTKSEFDLSEIGIQSIFDIIIADNTLFILSSDKKIITYELSEDSTKFHIINEGLRGNKLNKSGYAYLSYMIFIKNFHKDFFSLLVKASVPLTMVFMLYSQYGFYKSSSSIPGILLASTFIILSSSLTILSIIVKNIVIIFRKRSRLDNLLDVYNRIDNIKIVSFRNSIFMGLVFTITVFMIFYSNGVNGFSSSILSFLCGAGLTAIMYYCCIKSIRKFKENMDNMVFELLSLKIEDGELFCKISSEVKRLRRSGIEKYRIKVHAKDKIKNDIIKIIKYWANSRRKITGDIGRLNNKSDFLVFDLNLKDRDIKYSRISVIEDFICYITNFIKISSVIIETADDEEKIA